METEELGLRYLEVYGDFAFYSLITERKKIDCLNKFKYLSRAEYHNFKQNNKEQHMNKKN